MLQDPRSSPLIWGPYTYFSTALTLTSTVNITKGSMIDLCHILNAKYADKHITFEPEPITEGGIVYVFDPKYYPDGAYKTMRICFRNPKGKSGRGDVRIGESCICNWAPVRPDVMTAWEGDPTILLSANLSITVNLKAFHGAPVFTQDELRVFIECARQVGFRANSKLPRRIDLEDRGPLGSVFPDNPAPLKTSENSPPADSLVLPADSPPLKKSRSVDVEI